VNSLLENQVDPPGQPAGRMLKIATVRPLRNGGRPRASPIGPMYPGRAATGPRLAG